MSILKKIKISQKFTEFLVYQNYSKELISVLKKKTLQIGFLGYTKIEKHHKKRFLGVESQLCISAETNCLSICFCGK